MQTTYRDINRVETPCAKSLRAWGRTQKQPKDYLQKTNE